MTREPSHENDLNYAIQITRIILRIIGTWPAPYNSSSLERIGCRIQNCICYFLFLFILIPGLMRIFLKEKSTYMRLAIIGPLCNCATGMFKYSVLLYRAEEIRRLVGEMKDDWEKASGTEDREIMMAKARVGRRLILLFAIFMYSSGMSYRTIFPLSKGRMITPDNRTVRALACPSYFGKIDEQTSPAYEVVFIIQFFAGFVTYSITSGVCGLAAFFIMHLCGQLRILINHINGLIEGEDLGEKVVGKRIAIIVEHQIKARSFLKNVQEVLQYMCFAEMLSCTSLTCLVGYYVLMEWEKHNTPAVLTCSLLAVSFAFSIFIFTYIGQLLDDETTDVGLNSTTIDWYRLPVKKSKCMILIIAMSNYPMRLTAGKMMYMSLNTFTALMKTAFGYLNILRSVVM